LVLWLSLWMLFFLSRDYFCVLRIFLLLLRAKPTPPLFILNCIVDCPTFQCYSARRSWFSRMVGAVTPLTRTWFRARTLALLSSATAVGRSGLGGVWGKGVPNFFFWSRLCPDHRDLMTLLHQIFGRLSRACWWWEVGVSIGWLVGWLVGWCWLVFFFGRWR
jgi:hypothetical protein